MLSNHVDVSMDHGVADAYLTRPEDGSFHPAVLLLTDVFGLRPVVEDLADRIADDGFVVLAPNVFYRAGRCPLPEVPDPALLPVEPGPDQPQKIAAYFRPVRSLIDELTPELAVADGVRYIDYLADVAAPGPVAVAGYCLGGRLGWRIAAAHPARIAALAAFHTNALVVGTPDSPHRSASQLTAELYFGFADEDMHMDRGQIAVLEETLTSAGLRYRSEVYTGAMHGFTMADLPAYDEAADQRHLNELRSLLRRTFGDRS